MSFQKECQCKYHKKTKKVVSIFTEIIIVFTFILHLFQDYYYL